MFGTRPCAIKMAPLVRALRARPRIETYVVSTGQHRDMLDPLVRAFNLKVDCDLRVMEQRQTLSGLTARILQKLEDVVREQRPDWIVVHGDTTTALCGALSAYYHQVPLAHVEAGLRTRDKHHPYPEEANRVMVDYLSDLMFAPTAGARDNLMAEGRPEEDILITGNTVIDALLQALEEPFSEKGTPLADLPQGRTLVLVTAHRRESFGGPLEQVCLALRDVARARPDALIVYPVHRNPQVQGVAHRLLEGLPNVRLIEPLEYLPFVHLLNRATLVVTDSGGLQEEAPSLGKPVLVLRQVTERPEAVAAGTVKVVGTDRGRIVAETLRLLEDRAAYRAMANAANPYGDGRAAERIVASLLERGAAGTPRPTMPARLSAVPPGHPVAAT